MLKIWIKFWILSKTILSLNQQNSPANRVVSCKVLNFNSSFISYIFTKACSLVKAVGWRE